MEGPLTAEEIIAILNRWSKYFYGGPRERQEVYLPEFLAHVEQLGSRDLKEVVYTFVHGGYWMTICRKRIQEYVEFIKGELPWEMSSYYYDRPYYTRGYQLLVDRRLMIELNLRFNKLKVEHALQV